MTGWGRGGGEGLETRPPQPRDPPSHGLPSRVGLVVPGVKCLPPPPRPPPPWAWRAGDDAEERGWPSPLIRSIPGAGLGAGATPRGSRCSHLVCSRRSGPVGAFTGGDWAGSNSSSRVLQTTPGARHRGTPQQGLDSAPAGSTFRGRPQSLPPAVPMPGRHPAPTSPPPRSHQCGSPSPQISLCRGRRGFCSVTGP